MPNRLLKEGICTSDAVNMLSSDSEVLFYRLLVVSDDLGHMDGRPAIIKSMCFPLKEKVTTHMIKTWLTELESATLIQRYKSPDQKEYIAILKWDQRVRANPKYPLPTDGNVLTSDSKPPLGVGVGVGVRGRGRDRGKGESKEKASRLSEDFVMPVEWEEWYFSERKHSNLSELEITFATFKDYWIAKPGKDGTKLNWFSTFRNWVRRDKNWSKSEGKFDPVAYANRNTEGNNAEPREKDITDSVVRTD